MPDPARVQTDLADLTTRGGPGYVLCFCGNLESDSEQRHHKRLGCSRNVASGEPTTRLMSESVPPPELQRPVFGRRYLTQRAVCHFSQGSSARPRHWEAVLFTRLQNRPTVDFCRAALDAPWHASCRASPAQGGANHEEIRADLYLIVIMPVRRVP